MTDKSRAYSDSAVTIIIKGDGWADAKRHIDDANSLAGELRRATEQIAKLEAELTQASEKHTYWRAVAEKFERQLAAQKGGKE